MLLPSGRWRACEARLIGWMNELWWSRYQEGYGGVSVLVKEKLCDKVVEVRRIKYRLISVAIVFEKEALRVVCSCASQREVF